MTLLEKLEANWYTVRADGWIVNQVGYRCPVFYRKGRPYIKARIKQEDGSIKEERISAHLVVAEKFLPPKPAGCDFLMFKNGKATDIRATNLEWATLSTCQTESKLSRLRRAGMVRLELGEITWQHAVSKYKINSNVAYSTWKKAKGSNDE